MFTTPTWLLDQDILAQTGRKAPDVMRQVQTAALSRVLSTRVLTNLTNAEEIQGHNADTVNDLFGDLNRTIWSELSTGRTPDIYRRGLQSAYVKSLISMAGTGTPSGAIVIIMSGSPASPASTDIPARATYELKNLQARLKSASPANATARMHYQYLAKLIADALDPK